MEIAVFSKDKKKEAGWIRDLREVLEGRVQVEVSSFEFGSRQSSRLVLIDAAMPDLASVLSQIDPKGRAFFLVVDDPDELPTAFVEAKVDDVLVWPFRTVEVISKLRQFELI